MVAIYIVSYNNLPYVKNMLSQLDSLGVEDIRIVDNDSRPEVIEGLHRLVRPGVKLHLLKENLGPRLYNFPEKIPGLPNTYILTDPDLGLNPTMPKDFINRMLEISNRHKAYVVGLALRLDDSSLMRPMPAYIGNLSLLQWESQFWRQRIQDSDYELYKADIDTTFCLINNKHRRKMRKRGTVSRSGLSLRVAGEFTARHLPWYKNPGVKPFEVLEMYRNAPWSSNGGQILSDLGKLFNIYKNKKGEEVVIPKSDNRTAQYWLENWERAQQLSREQRFE